MHPDCQIFMTEMLRVLRAERDAKRLCQFDMEQSINVSACGTSACAIGLAGLDPWFRARGLGFRHEDADGWPTAIRCAGQQVMYAGRAVDFYPGILPERCPHNLAHAFSIPGRDFTALFSGDYTDRRTTVGDVINAIERYLATGAVPNAKEKADVPGA